MNRTKSLAECVWGGVKGVGMRRAKSALLAVFFALFAVSCNNALLPEPDLEKIQGSVVNKDAQIEAPLALTASQGYRHIVTLKWEAVTGAAQYIIYAADEPQDTFEQIMETKGAETSKTITETAGTSRYYKVCAKDYNGNLSVPSEIALGSTLAVPVITEIQPQDDGSTVVVNWWMENCNAHTYQSDIEYKIEVFKENEDSEKKLVDEKIVGNTETSTRIENLTPLTKYYYQVSAYLLTEKDSDEKTNIETSNLIDEATARRIIPSAPVELSAEKGLSEDCVRVSWKLPAFCDVSTTAENFEKHPLYFSIERKLKDEADDSYQKLASYIGTMPKSETNPFILWFDCTDASKNAPDISVASEQDEQEEVSALYPQYVSLRKITYTDRTAERDKQYTYRVQSFVDDVARTISSDTARATADGWKIATCTFGYAAAYTTSAETKKFEKMEINFKECAFNAWDEQYVYYLAEAYRPFADESGVFGDYGNIRKFENGFTQVQAFTIPFNFTGSQKPNEGYYKFRLYICPKDSDGYEHAISTITADKTILVTDDEHKFVKVADAEVDDGYANKFRLSWNYESNATYTISWEDEDGTTGSIVPNKSELESQLEERTVDDKTVTYTTYYHTGVPDGVRRSYTIKADAGIPNEKKVEGSYETLGVVVPEQVGIAYDEIVLSWKSVAQAKKAADAFAVTYADNTVAESEIVYDEERDAYTCTVKNPRGYDDPAASGKPLSFNISATSEKHDDQTTTARYDKARTLGPALINAKGGDGTDKTITMTWDKVDGASGYLIYRTAYKDALAKEIESADTLYYPATDDNTSGSPSLVAGEQVTGKSIIITKSGGKYTLQDTDTPAPDSGASDFQRHQARISWGRPFGYIVLPVKDKKDFTFKAGTKTLADGAKVDYTKGGDVLAEVKGNTYGYGMNTAASKSDSATNVSIEWEKPNAQTGLVPTLYRRAAGTDGSFEKVKEAENLSVTDTLNDEDKYGAFEYIVRYGKKTGDQADGSALSVPASLLAELAATTETRYAYPEGTAEPRNKGYALAAELTAAIDEENTYYETIRWWDYAQRVIGPEKVTLSVYNNNIKDGWVDILTADGTGSTLAEDGTIDITIKDPAETGRVSVAPKSIVAGEKGTTDGMLKVLRDYKHYYKAKVEGKDKKGIMFADTVGVHFEEKTDEETEAVTKIEVKDVCACREITDEELVRAATLAMSIGFQKSYNDRKGDKWSALALNQNTYNSPSGGSLNFKSSGNTRHELTYSNFIATLQTKSGYDATFLIINGQVNGSPGLFNVNSPSSYNGSITISSMNDFYSGTISFNELKYNSSTGITIKQNGVSEKSFGNITPFPFKDNSNKFLNDNEEWQ